MRANEALAQVRAQPAISAPSSSPAPAAEPRRSVVIGLQKWEIQESTLANLRQIDAARKQHQLEERQLASSIQELVGRKSYIKAVRPVDGEDYSGLSMDPAQPLTVTTVGGMAVTFDPSGIATTKPDYPPEVVRVKELGDRVQQHIITAATAYRQANGGKNPPNEQALLPYFLRPETAPTSSSFSKRKRRPAFSHPLPKSR